MKGTLISIRRTLNAMMVADAMMDLKQHETVISVILDQLGPWVLEVMLSLYLLLASVTSYHLLSSAGIGGPSFRANTVNSGSALKVCACRFHIT